MPTVKMNTLWLSKLKFEGERMEYRDQDTKGLWLRVGSDSWTWFYVYKQGGKTQRVKIGIYPSTSLAAARKEAENIRGGINAGKDPAAERREEKKNPTFGDVAQEYLEKHAIHKRTLREDQRILDHDVLPLWKDTKIAKITRRQIIALLDDIVSRGSPIMANRVLALIRKIFNWGIERDIVETSPCLRVKPPAPEKSRDRWLSHEEIRAVWEALGSEPVCAPVFKVLLLTGQRLGEVLAMRWEELDLAANVWTIPAEKSKNSRTHSVPLSPEVRGIIDAMTRKNEWVFPSPTRSDRHLANMGKAHQRIKELSGVEFHIHDLRRTCATGMARLGIDRVVIGKILNHTDGSVTAIYERHGYEEEKRHALELWASHVMRTVDHEIAKVITLPVR
jgi:integrase